MSVVVEEAAVVAAKNNLVPLGVLPAYHAARDPRRTMITDRGIATSRAEFEARANKRARMLAARGVVADDLVTIALPNGLEFYETVFAVWKLGATPNPVSSKLPDAELRGILDLVRPRLVVGADPARLAGDHVVAAGAALDESLSAEPLPPAVARYWKAMTSGGSTGRPKVIVDHLVAAWNPSAPTLGQQVDDTLLNAGPLYHTAPFSLMFGGLFAGAHVVEMGKFDAEQMVRLIAAERVNWINLVPTMMHRISRLPSAIRNGYDLSSLRAVYHMASACPAWLKEEWIDWLGPDRIWEVYSSTERSGMCLISGSEWLEHRGSVGRPFNCQVMIAGEDGRSLPAGEVGEIYFLPEGGRNSTYHYVGAEAKALGDWETVGDIGYLDADGYLYLADRRTDMIISGGANVYPAEVEAALDSHPHVASSIVIGLPDEDLGQRVHAIVQPVASARDQLAAEDLRAHLEPLLVRYKTPRTYEFVDEPLRDDAGKARRRALQEARSPAGAQALPGQDASEPRVMAGS